ncbi:hypothetical protein NQ317_000213 [Molorchus minor]|uniref:SWIM-type domain-containing protein n=1 Tax=Molorchus minor TaxID=1323400 RepID=A0ABQ9JHN7_9CUCU|nr:hypothetical protein NQ317_000213 [Molorchus minor]
MSISERLLNASHLILCGIEEKCEPNLNIFALCLQTSALSSPPHEISGIIKNSVENGMSVTSMSCTCKAGLGGTCKHIAAVFLYRTSLCENKTTQKLASLVLPILRLQLTIDKIAISVGVITTKSKSLN